VSNASAVVENATFLFRSLYLPHEVYHWLYISKFTRLRAVYRRQHGSCILPHAMYCIGQTITMNNRPNYFTHSPLSIKNTRYILSLGLKNMELYHFTRDSIYSVTISLSADPSMTDLLQRGHSHILSGIEVGYGKLSIFDI